MREGTIGADISGYGQDGIPDLTIYDAPTISIKCTIDIFTEITNYYDAYGQDSYINSWLISNLEIIFDLNDKLVNIRNQIQWYTLIVCHLK